MADRRSHVSAEHNLSEVTAIDILLDPDDTMIEQASMANDRLRRNYPQGYLLDESHRPHVTVIQCYVKTSALHELYALVEDAVRAQDLSGWRLKTTGYYYIPDRGLGLAGIVIEPSDDLLAFQQRLVDAVAPSTVEHGSADAFATTPDDPTINQATIDYIPTYIPEQIGERYNPHVTIGLAHQVYLDEMLNEEFDAFYFSPTAVSIYQLGNFGTARRKLAGWELRSNRT